MTVHLLKLSVGSESFDDMIGYQTRRLTEARRAGRMEVLTHHTRMMPRRRPQVLGGGSIYWVVKGVILCRNPVTDLVPLVDEEGRRFCQIRYGPALVRVDPRPCRIFQGWRYLEPTNAPRDLEPGEIDEAMPPRMAAELRALGLI
jgi:hypothetical protein